MGKLGYGWSSKSIRLRTDYRDLTHFIVFYCKRFKNIENEKDVFNEVFKFSLEYIKSNNIKDYELVRIRERREPQLFLLTDELINDLNNSYDNLKDEFNLRKVSVGFFTELLLFIWIEENVNKKYLKILESINWSIENVKY